MAKAKGTAQASICAKATKTKAKKPKSRQSLIGIIAKGEIAKGNSDEQALATVWANVPDCRTQIEGIESIRSRMRSAGYPVPTSKQAADMVLDRRRNAAPSMPPRKPKRRRPSARKSRGYVAKRTA